MVVPKKPRTGAGMGLLYGSLWFVALIAVALATDVVRKPVEAHANATPAPAAAPAQAVVPAPPATATAAGDPETWSVPECPETVCAQVSLAPERKKLLEQYAKIEPSLTGEQRSALRSSHAEWLKSFESCQEPACWSQRYEERSTALSKIVTPDLQ